MPFRAKDVRLALLVFLVAAGFRFWNLNIPFVETYNSMTRQAISATVTRNFYQNGFRFFYPEIDENGRGPYLFQGEMPVYSYLMAWGYRLTGGVHEAAARSVSVLFSLGTALLLYGFTRRLYSSKAALVAAAFFSFSPLSLALSRSVQPESAMLFFSVLSLYSFYRFLEQSRSRWLVLTACSLFLAIGTKFYNLYIFIPLAVLAVQHEGLGAFRNWKLYAMSLFSLSALAWYVYMWHAERTQNLVYVVYQMTDTRGPAQLSYGQLLLSPYYLLRTGKVFLIHLVTPLGLLFLAGNFFKKPQGRSDGISLAWLLSSVLLMLVFWRTVIDHSYYQLPMVLPLAVLAGRGAQPLWERLKLLPAAGRAALLLLFAGAQLFVLGYLYPGLYRIPDSRQAIVRAGLAVQALVPKEALVLASYQTSTIQLYYCNRKGWAFDSVGSDEELVRRLEEYRKKGAEYFVLSTLEVLRDNPRFDAQLRNYPLLAEQPDYRIYDLRTRAAVTA